MHTEDYLGRIKDLKTKIRDGLFLAPSRPYRERYVEPFIRKKYGLSAAESDGYDALDKHGAKYEIKCCKVLSKNPDVSNKEPLIKRIVAENYK